MVNDRFQAMERCRMMSMDVPDVILCVHQSTSGRFRAITRWRGRRTPGVIWAQYRNGQRIDTRDEVVS